MLKVLLIGLVALAVAAASGLLLLVIVHRRIRQGLTAQGRGGWSLAQTARLARGPLVAAAGAGAAVTAVGLAVVPALVRRPPGLWLLVVSLGLVALGSAGLVVALARTQIIDRRKEE